MRNLLVSEWRRFRTPALLGAAVHALVLGVLAIADELFLPSQSNLLLAGLAYALGGLLLGLYQIASYRRSDLWMFLLHRPLAPRSIFAALAGAAAAVLALAVAVPLALAAGLCALGDVGVDPRHFLLAPYAWLCALAFYLGGCVMALTPWRGAFLVGTLAVVGLAPRASWRRRVRAARPGGALAGLARGGQLARRSLLHAEGQTGDRGRRCAGALRAVPGPVVRPALRLLGERRLRRGGMAELFGPLLETTTSRPAAIRGPVTSSRTRHCRTGLR